MQKGFQSLNQNLYFDRKLTYYFILLKTQDG